MYNRTCRLCGYTLDPDERCDCQSEKEKQIRYFESVLSADQDGQIHFIVEKEIENGIRRY